MPTPDYASAVPLWAPPSRYWAGRNNTPVRYVIVHGTAGGTRAQDVATWLNTNTTHVASVHYLIGQDGTIVQSVSEENTAWGNGDLMPGHDPWWASAGHPANPNYETISIEHCKPDAQNATPLTPAQQAASFRLIKDICLRHKIPMRAADASGGITGHHSIDPVNRAMCPGNYPWDALWAYLGSTPITNAPQGGVDMSWLPGVPLGWTDSNGTLSVDGVPVVLGFRLEVLKGWDPNNKPLAPEGGFDPCDPTDPTSGPGTRQYFTDTVLVYHQSNGAITRPHLGRLAMDAANAASAAAVAPVVKAKVSKVKADLAVVEADVADVQAAEGN